MPKWNIDPDHSVAALSIRHLMVANVHGQFNKLSGVIHFDLSDINSSTVDVDIDVSGIQTGIKKRDDHLRSPDFFDIEKYPKIIFKSTRIESIGTNRLKVTGDLTIHKVTNTIILEGEYFGPVKSPYGGEITMGFTATTSVNREDFGITWNEPMEDGGFMIGKNVQITINVEADRVSD